MTIRSKEAKEGITVHVKHINPDRSVYTITIPDSDKTRPEVDQFFAFVKKLGGTVTVIDVDSDDER
jgi:ABC-type molybdate transport system substrate-binding protein